MTIAPSLQIRTPIFGGISSPIKRLDAQSVGWSRARDRVGGDMDGEFVIDGTQESELSLLDYFRNWLGCDVVELAGSWRGFIWRMTFTHMGVTRAIEYANLHNAVRSKYKEVALNGGFENAGSGTTFLNWSEVTTGGSVNDEATVVASGGHAARLTRSGASSPYIYQDITVVAGYEYRLRFSAAGDGSVGGSYSVYDSTNTADILASTATGNTTTAYRTVTFDFVAPQGCAAVRFSFIAPGAAGSAYFDNVSAQRLIDGQPAYSYTDWATNAQSISRYGRREYIIDAGQYSPDEAETLRDDRIAVSAWPSVSTPLRITNVAAGTQPVSRLEVEVVGYWATTFFQYVSATDGGVSKNASDLFSDVISADCPWLTSGQIRSNADQVIVDDAREIRAGDLLQQLVTDAWRVWIDSQLRVFYEEIDTDNPRLFRRDGQYRDRLGDRRQLDPFGIHAGIVVRDLDWPGSTSNYGGLLQRDSDFIAQEVSVTAAGELSVTS